MTTEIRAAGLADIPAVLRLWVAAAVHPTVTDDAGALGGLVAGQPGALLVADDGGELIGSVIAAWDGWRGSIHRLAILPARRRRGLATALVLAAVASLRARGARRIGALVVAADRDAVDFWDSLRAAGIEADPLPKWRYVAGSATLPGPDDRGDG